MSWKDEVDEIEARKAFALEMGGEEGVKRQHARGKLTVRERLDRLADKKSFTEFLGLSGNATYAGNKLEHFTPKGSVEGYCKLHGRKVVVTAGDFTVRGGSGGTGGGLGQELSSNRRAQEWRIPYVRLLDASGGSVRSFEEIGRTYLPDGNVWSAVDTQILSEIPVVSAVMGSVAGLPAINACMAHFNLMVKDTSQLFPGGPPVVKAALGYDITKEELGGDKVHTRQSGVIDNLAVDEEDAFAQIKQFLSYLPANVWEMPPRGDTTDDPGRAEDFLLSAIPRDRRQTYKVHGIINAIVDAQSFFEIAPRYGRSRVVGLARLNGYPIGLMANNPRQKGGTTDVAAGTKVMRLLQLCDTFHLPVISLADEPGFMVGLDSEKQGIERAGAALVAMTCSSQMPWATVVMGKLYGVAGQCHHRPSGMFQRYAWPSANWGSMHIAGGAAAAYRREIETAEDSEAKLQEIEERLQALASPFRTAEATGQDIIDPRETRARLCEFVEDAQRVVAGQLGKTAARYLPF
jgi:methylmalonyl-CoA decarboxylase subunit alpha